jgi:hypothetical protein
MFLRETHGIPGIVGDKGRAQALSPADAMAARRRRLPVQEPSGNSLRGIAHPRLLVSIVCGFLRSSRT